jgi:hypothetical protein
VANVATVVAGHVVDEDAMQSRRHGSTQRAGYEWPESNGSPYILVSPGVLAAGASTNVSIRFQNPSNATVNFTPVAYAGIF